MKRQCDKLVTDCASTSAEGWIGDTVMFAVDVARAVNRN